MKKLLALFGVAVLISIASCSGGGGGDSAGGGGGGGLGGEGVADDGRSVAEKLSSAKTLLEAGDIAGAEAQYTAVIGSAAVASSARALESDNADARFGRALCNILLLMEKDPSKAILAGFGQAPLAASQVFGPTGYFALSLTDRAAAKALLPFNSLWDNRALKNRRGIISHMTPGYTSGNLISSVNELMGSLDIIISDLQVAARAGTISYVIPKAMYSGDADITINHADVVAMLSGLYMVKAGVNLGNSWTFNMDISDIIDANGKPLRTKQEMLDRMNAQFGLRADNQLADARINIQKSLLHAKEALTEILAGSSGGVLNLSDVNQPIYQDLYDMASSGVLANSGVTQLSDITPAISASLDNFFTNPPNIEFDPFVIKANGKFAAVEYYWQQMIYSVCDFTIGTRGVKVFSTAVRQIYRPYYQLFNQIMGHTFGRHKAGRGATTLNVGIGGSGSAGVGTSAGH